MNGVNLIRFALATPAFKQMAHVKLIDQAFRLQEVALATMMEAQRHVAKSSPSDRLMIRTAKPWAFQVATLMQVDTCNVALSRNQLLYHSITMPSIDWLLMCDADTHVADAASAVAALRMMAEGSQRMAAAIAAPVLARTGHYNFTLKDAKGLLPPQPSEFAGKVLEVDRVGAAFLALNLAWFRDNWGKWNPADPWFAFKYTSDQGVPDHISEDFAFCDGVRQRGGTILLDARFEPIHEGAQEAWLKNQVRRLKQENDGHQAASAMSQAEAATKH